MATVFGKLITVQKEASASGLKGLKHRRQVMPAALAPVLYAGLVGIQPLFMRVLISFLGIVVAFAGSTGPAMASWSTICRRPVQKHREGMLTLTQ